MGADKKVTFALFFGNRGFFPASLMTKARHELSTRLEHLGYGHLMMEACATRHGAVETPAEGQKYARFLKENAGKFDGVILSLPNFGDETGAVTALKDADVPILIQAYPDEFDKMGPESRRDAFCGKFSVMDVFHQYGIKFTALKPHTVAPSYFAAVCRVVKGLKNMVVGAIGARTTAFKTVRIDEMALQQNGITMETFDLSAVLARMEELEHTNDAYKQKAERLRSYSDWRAVPEEAFDKLVRLGVALDEFIAQHNLDALALRCWPELQVQVGVSPCVLLSEINDRPLAAACEVDVGNAVAMHALRCASGDVASCLDWNNNYGEEQNKCILFHCGSAPRSMMTETGKVIDHLILANAVGPGHSYGCNVGRIAPSPITFASMTTEGGRLKFYLGEGRFTGDEIPQNFFGCAGVAEIENLQDVLLHVGREGYRHHTSVTRGRFAAPMAEALGNYLGFEVALPQQTGAA